MRYYFSDILARFTNRIKNVFQAAVPDILVLQRQSDWLQSFKECSCKKIAKLIEDGRSVKPGNKFSGENITVEYLKSIRQKNTLCYATEASQGKENFW